MAKIKEIEDLKNTYLVYKREIISRLKDFKQIWEQGTECDIFTELIFCIFTPQSKAKSCWTAVTNLRDKKLLFNGSACSISKKINIVRFKNKKSEYTVNARKLFKSGDKISIKSKISKFSIPFEAREWLVKNVKGLGYKEASHFLRNIGLGEKLAILDRHILKNLKLMGVINKIPSSLSRNQYLEIEKGLDKFAKKIKIPMSHLDLLLWCKETGEIFK